MSDKKGKKAKPRKTIKEKSMQFRKPKQSRLPGMEDDKIEELHSLSEEYVSVRDRRIALNQEEKPLKDQLLAAMHSQGKTHYKHNGLEITVVHESEKVKVKLHKDEDAEVPF